MLTKGMGSRVLELSTEDWIVWAGRDKTSQKQTREEQNLFIQRIFGDYNAKDPLGFILPSTLLGIFVFQLAGQKTF